jgi:hypothetical protein
MGHIADIAIKVMEDMGEKTHSVFLQWKRLK